MSLVWRMGFISFACSVILAGCVTVADASRTNEIMGILDAKGLKDIISLDEQDYGSEMLILVTHSPQSVAGDLCAARRLSLDLALSNDVLEEVGESWWRVLSLGSCREVTGESVFVSIDGRPEELDWDRIGQAIFTVEAIILDRASETVAYSSEEVRLSIRSLRIVDIVGISQMDDGVVVRLLGEKFAPQLVSFRLTLNEGVVQSVSVDDNDAIEVVPDRRL